MCFLCLRIVSIKVNLFYHLFEIFFGVFVLIVFIGVGVSLYIVFLKIWSISNNGPKQTS